jgi:hypothetical protein
VVFGFISHAIYLMKPVMNRISGTQLRPYPEDYRN